MMALLNLLFMFVCLGATQHLPPSATESCVYASPAPPGMPTLTYTPYMTPQIAPTSTVYQRIITEYFYAVDCRYAAIQQVDNNPPADGPFFFVSTIPTLTITRIGCMPMTSVITRRDLRGDAVAETIHPKSMGVIYGQKLAERASLQEQMFGVADKLNADVPPSSDSLTVEAYRYLIQINTALFAINLYNAGFNMTTTCSELSDPVTQARLTLNAINPVQAASIVCYARDYGLFFNMSNAELLDDLTTLIYAVQVKSGFTSDNVTLCNSLDLGPAPELGIDASGVQSYVCAGVATTTSSSPSVPASASTESNVTISATGGLVTGTGGLAPTGILPPFANSTATGIGIEPSNMTETPLAGTAPTGDVGPYLNSTTIPGPGAVGTGAGASATGVIGGGNNTDPLSIVFPTGTEYGGNLPPNPSSPLHYAVWTTSTTPAAQLPEW